MSEVKKSAGTAVNNATGSNQKKSSNMFAILVVPICLIVSFALFYGYFSQQFEDVANHKKPLNFMGSMYEGGFVVPILMATFLTCICIIVERGIAIFQAKGKSSGQDLVRKVQYHLANKNVDAAIAECDKQAGSVGSVLKSGLIKYKEMIHNTDMSTDQKVLAINTEMEESTALEIPTLEKNMVFLSTIASVATLIGLFGTVMGMIRAFAAMSTAGAPDATALASGISEALINTALGIGTSAFAIIFYNVWTTQIDGITYAIDESTMTLTQSFATNYK